MTNSYRNVSPQSASAATAGGAGTLVLDWNLEIVGADAGVCRMLERERDEIVGRNCLELVTPPRRAREAFDALRAAPAEGHTDRFTFVRLAGDTLYAEVDMRFAVADSRPCIVLTVQDRERRAVRRIPRPHPWSPVGAR